MDSHPGSKRSSSSVHCPLCGELIAPEFARSPPSSIPRSCAGCNGKTRAADASAGACPECASKPPQAVRAERSRTSLHDELLLALSGLLRGGYPPAAGLRRFVQANSAIYRAGGDRWPSSILGFYPHPDLTRPENRILRASTLPAKAGRRGQLPQGAGLQLARHDDLLRGGWQWLHVGLALPGHRLPGEPGAGQNRQSKWPRHPRGGYPARPDMGAGKPSPLQHSVVNISLGGDHPANGKLSDLDRLVEEAVSCGMVVVAASGNGGVGASGAAGQRPVGDHRRRAG